MTASSCVTITEREDYRSGDSFRTYDASMVSRAVVWIAGEPRFEITNDEVIAELWSASRESRFRADGFIIMCGHFADIEYLAPDGGLVAATAQMNARHQVVQYTQVNGESEIFTGDSARHAELVYNLVEQFAATHPRSDAAVTNALAHYRECCE